MSFLSHELSRRSFLGASALSAAAALAGSAEAADRRWFHERARKQPWFDEPMRWINLTMVQDDPGKFDPDFWIDFCRRAHGDAASWNAGGIVAFYPTQLPLHRRNAAMGSSDPFGYLVEGARRLGMIVTARVDHHATYEETAQAHPEWIAVDAQGKRRRHWANPELWVTCCLGMYNETFMTDVMKEIVAMYGVDGFNHNRWSGSGVCYCDYCREHFRRFSGGELPARQSAGDPQWQDYLRWKEDRIFQLWDLWDAAVRKINPSCGVLPGIGSVDRRELDMSKLRRRAHTLYLDYQGRSGYSPPWMAGRSAKELRAVLGDKPVGLTINVGPEERYRWKDGIQSEAEIRIWASEGVAAGCRPKVCKFSGFLHDRRWVPIVEALYQRLWKIEPYLRNVGPPLAEVAIVHSQQTERAYRNPAGGAGNEEHLNGMYHALVEARIPFEMIHESFFLPEEMDRFKLLILPNVAALSDAQCAQLRAYVGRGGSLLATQETSLYDEQGRRRNDFALADLWGVHCRGTTEGPIKNSYLRVEHSTRHPILDGFEDADRLLGTVYRTRVEPTAEFAVRPVTLVPAYPDLPMEEMYPRQPKTDIAEVYLRQLGPGRVVYFPNDIDRTFWEILNVDHGRLLKNAVLWAIGRQPSVVVSGPGLLDLAVWRQASSMTVHLVNLTNPMMFKGPFRELLPIGPQEVRWKLPEGKTPRRVRLLMADEEPPHRQADGWLEVTVPSILDHEIVAIDF